MEVLIYGVIIIIEMVMLSSVFTEEQCFHRFEYEYNVLEKLILYGQKLEQQENETASLRKELKDARQAVDELTRQLRFSNSETYTRWGRTTCPDGAVLVYEGLTAGGLSTEPGAAVNTLCLSNDPEWNEYNDEFSGGTRIYGAEYLTADSINSFAHLHNHNIPCAVCRVTHGNVLMVPGKKSCHEEYKLQYSGYLMAGKAGEVSSTEFICMDEEPEKIESGAGDQIGKHLAFVQGECGSLKCPPYVDGRELTCAVCSFPDEVPTQSLQPIS